MKYIIKRISILFGICLIIFTLTSCNEKKEDPLYIDALSFLYDEGNGKIVIENKHQDIYLTVGEQSFYTDCYVYTCKYKGDKYSIDYLLTDNLYDKNFFTHADVDIIPNYFEAGTTIKLFTASSKFKYEIIRSYDMHPFVYLHKAHTTDAVMGGTSSRSSLDLIKGQEFYIMGQMGRFGGVPGYGIFSYDVTGCIDGSQRIKVLNANLTIDSITDINPETNIKFAKDCVLIKCTYIGEGELLSFNDIRYITEDIES